MKWWEHSLSIALFAGFILFSIIAYPLTPEDGNYLYDWALMTAGCFGGGAIIVLFASYLYERDSDPTKPPPDLPTGGA